MKRYLQLLGEMKNYQLPQATRALQDLGADDELVIVVPEQSMVDAIQQWATSQGYTVAPPKKIIEGMPRWQLTIKRAAPAEEKPPAQAPAPAG